MTSGADDRAGRRFLRIGCDSTYRAGVDTSTVFRVRPARDQHVRVTSERLSVEPDVAMRHHHDLYGNPCSRVVLPTGLSTMHYSAPAEVPDAPEEVDQDAPETAPGDLSDDVLHCALPSRHWTGRHRARPGRRRRRQGHHVRRPDAGVGGRARRGALRVRAAVTCCSTHRTGEASTPEG